MVFLVVIVLAALASLAYLLVFGLLLPGAASIYGFIAVSFFFPNWGTDYFGIAEIPAFFFAELVAGLAILLAISRCSLRGDVPAAARLEKRVFHIFLFAVAFHYLAYWPLKYLGYYPPANVDETVAIVYAVKAFIPLVFLYGCLRFIRTTAQAERMCWLFVICGLELLLEWVVFSMLGVLPSIGQYAFAGPNSSDPGKFKSLTENDPLAVGFISSVAAICTVYFAVVKKRPALALAAPLLLLPMFAVYQRTFVIGVMLAVMFFFWRVGGTVQRLGGLAACGLALVLTVWLDVDVEAEIETVYVGTPRGPRPESIGVDPLSLLQLASRLGIQARVLDTFVFLFPFGTGEYVQRYYLSSEAIPPVFQPSNVLIAYDYLRAMSGGKTTEAHNGFIEHLVSYGLLGVISLIMFIAATIHNYRLKGPAREQRVLHAATYAVLIFCGLFFMFYSYPKIYMIYLFFFHNTFLLRQSDEIRGVTA